jgi:hypothetical protein
MIREHLQHSIQPACGSTAGSQRPRSVDSRNDRTVRVPTNTAAYANKWRSELCRNCVRSPRNRWQTPTVTGSHRGVFCGGKSLNRLREEMFRYHSMQLAGIVFQACSFNAWASHRRVGSRTRSLAATEGQRGFKSCPEDRSAATVVVIELLLKGFAGARNQHYLQLWRPAA